MSYAESSSEQNVGPRCSKLAAKIWRIANAGSVDAERLKETGCVQAALGREACEELCWTNDFPVQPLSWPEVSEPEPLQG
ncbi:MAG TPA: hypothetical protein VIM53_00330 [Candidatus Saccharimonadales bacterium]